MSELQKFTQHIEQAQKELLMAFCAFGRAVRPAFIAMQAIFDPAANRKLRRAERSGNGAKFEWYLTKRVKRLVARSNPISGNPSPET